MSSIQIPGYIPSPARIEEIEKHEAEFVRSFLDREERELMEIPEGNYVVISGKVPSLWEEKK